MEITDTPRLDWVLNNNRLRLPTFIEHHGYYINRKGPFPTAREAIDWALKEGKSADKPGDLEG